MREAIIAIMRSGKTRPARGASPRAGPWRKLTKSFQTQKIAELERHREGRFNLDDREMLSQARGLASSHGYTVLQAVQQWHSSKGSSKAMPLGQVIEKFLAAKSDRCAAYMDKLRADMRLFQCHFAANRSIEPVG
jgi:hypothetical protein